MPTLAEILRAIKTAVRKAIFGKAPAGVPPRAKLNGRRGYGDDDLPTPRP
jgi:hypothetical protein